MSLIKEAFNYLKDESLTKYLLLFILLRLLLNVMVSYIMVLISDGRFNLIVYYMLFSYIQKMFDPLIIQPIIIRLTNSIHTKFYKKYTYQYNQLTYECKNLKMHSQFIMYVCDGYHSITSVIDWGLFESINLISAFISVIITFSKKNLIKHLFFFLIIYNLFYFTVIKKKQEQCSKIQKEYRNKRSQNNAKEYLYSIPFQYKEISPDFMINIKEDTLKSDLGVSFSWNQLLIINDTMIEFLSSMLIYVCSNNIMTFMLIIISMNKLSGAIQGLSSFITSYQRIKNDFNNFKEFWEKDLEFEKDFIELSINDHCVEIGKIEISRGDNYTITKDPSFGPFKLVLGMKILIQGPSGHGKSSFLKGIFGLIKTSNIDFSYGSGIQYYHSVSDYFQEIKERMPSSKVSLRDYFKGETNNKLIKEYLLQAWSEEEYERIIDSIRGEKDVGSNKDTDLLIRIDTDHVHEYDLLINEKLSGGQKSRLILWTRGYNVDTSHKEIIILDEPCPDVDFDGYIDNLKRFYKKYNHCTIFLIGHLCDCKRKSLDIKFDTELWIEDGIIKKIQDSDYFLA